MSQFLVLLYDSPAALERFSRLSPEEMQACIEQYVAWSERLAAEGRLVATEKLRDGTGRVLRGRGGAPVVTDGPFAETKEVIGGYFLIRAANYDDAVDVVRSCPHLEWDGTVEVREIEPVGVPSEG